MIDRHPRVGQAGGMSNLGWRWQAVICTSLSLLIWATIIHSSSLMAININTARQGPIVKIFWPLGEHHIQVVMATLYRLGSVCCDWKKDPWGGSNGMGIEVVEGLRWPAAGGGGDGCNCGMGIPACVSLSGSNLSLWDSFSMPLWFLWIQLSWACTPGVRTPLAHTCHTQVPQTHIPCIPVPLVHFYSSPAVLEFWVLLVVVEVRPKSEGARL